MSRQSNKDAVTGSDVRHSKATASSSILSNQERLSPPSLYKHLQKHYSSRFNADPISRDLFSDADRRLENAQSQLDSTIKSNSTEEEEEDDNFNDDDDCGLMFNEDEENGFNMKMRLNGDSKLPFSLPHVPFVSDWNVGALNSDPVMKCYICTQYRSNFFCEYCVRNGDFTSQRPNEVIKERFAEKKLRYYELKRRIDSINEKLDNKFKNLIEKNRLRHEIDIRKANIQLLSTRLDEVNKEFSVGNRQARDVQKQICSIRSKNKKMVCKLKEMQNRVSTLNESLKRQNQQFDVTLNSMHQNQRTKLVQLFEFIFPIKNIDSEDQSDQAFQISSCETSPLLTFSGESANGSISGRDDNYFQRETKPKEERLSIVQSWLPSSGDYSAYSICAIQQKDLVASSSLMADGSIRNTAQRISSALSFSTQLTLVIASFFDLPLPKKLNFCDFDTKLDSNGRYVFLSETELANKVARLNANIVNCMLSLNIDLKDNSNIRCDPRATLLNLQRISRLENHLPVNRRAPISSKALSKWLHLAEPLLKDDLALIKDEDELNLTARSKSDEENDDELNDLDWESVPEMPFANESLTYSNTASVTTNIISSVVSMWRAATRK